MDVFLIPIAADRYEPYCEPADDDAPTAEEAPARGPLRRMWARFQAMLAEAEQANRQPEAEPETPTWTGRLMRWVAERVAEQRLLWQLRKHEAATLHFPADLTAERAESILRAQLQADYDRHRRWMFVDATLAAITGPLFFFVPGPNLVAYFFVFRAVGHYLSQRGGRHGLDQVRWSWAPSDALVDLRTALALEDPHRSEHIHRVAARLRLQHLPLFVARVALRSA